MFKAKYTVATYTAFLLDWYSFTCHDAVLRYSQTRQP